MNRLLTGGIAFLLASCSSLKSYTTIKPGDSFILGNNQHGTFRANLTNTSSNDLTVHMAPLDGGRHSFQTVAPRRSVSVKVDKSTALVVTNNSSDTAVVKLKVTGDTGLSMKYREKEQ